MDRKTALEMVEKQIAGPRFQHTLGVVDTAVQLAGKYGADAKKAELAAIFHDYAKTLPVAELRSIIISEEMDPRLLDYHAELWHGPAAVFLVKRDAGILDEEILNAIRYHTTGRANMPLLEKVVYLADYIEPGRHFPGVEEVRELAKADLDSALRQALSNTIRFLAEKNSAIFPDTFEAYNDLCMK
ncbi:MAG TPA: bis(5'-nucleosyl)-tetraphosphatase (symmetrical) YqeK [Bacillaceae bacterium]